MRKSILRLLATLSLALLPGCIGMMSYPAGPYEAMPAAPNVPVAGNGFGYIQIGLGMAGLPGQNDIRPGTAFSITMPPGGVILSAVYLGALVAIAATDDFNVYVDAGDVAAAPYLLGVDQGMSTGRTGPLEIYGVGMDAIFSWSTAEDLTYGGSIHTFSTGLGARFMGGLWEGTLWHALVGFELLWIDFENRPHALNFGPYVGFGLEAMLAPQTSVTADIRYAFLEGDADYDHWEFTGGFVLYW